mmetsp:Transcript_126712/g.364489  ORF Transcript_126712/g.364489 Transcript_126712/m.364489 type:complete len:441 (+) Transcript_126712:62-1384(+)
MELAVQNSALRVGVRILVQQRIARRAGRAPPARATKWRSMRRTCSSSTRVQVRAACSGKARLHKEQTGPPEGGGQAHPQTWRPRPTAGGGARGQRLTPKTAPMVMGSGDNRRFSGGATTTTTTGGTPSAPKPWPSSVAAAASAAAAAAAGGSSQIGGEGASSGGAGRSCGDGGVCTAGAGPAPPLMAPACSSPGRAGAAPLGPAQTASQMLWAHLIGHDGLVPSQLSTQVEWNSWPQGNLRTIWPSSTSSKQMTHSFGAAAVAAGPISYSGSLSSNSFGMPRREGGVKLSAQRQTMYGARSAAPQSNTFAAKKIAAEHRNVEHTTGSRPRVSSGSSSFATPHGAFLPCHASSKEYQLTRSIEKSRCSWLSRQRRSCTTRSATGSLPVRNCAAMEILNCFIRISVGNRRHVRSTGTAMMATNSTISWKVSCQLVSRRKSSK